MLDINSGQIARLERRNRLLTPWSLVVTALALAMPLTDSFGLRLAAQDKPKALSVSELAVVDERGTVPVRIGGQLPDAVVNGKMLPRGQKAAGVPLYDETGQEHSDLCSFRQRGANPRQSRRPNRGIHCRSQRGRRVAYPLAS